MEDRDYHQGELAGKFEMLRELVNEKLKDHEKRIMVLEKSLLKHGFYVSLIVGGIVILFNSVLPEVFKKLMGGMK